MTVIVVQTTPKGTAAPALTIPLTFSGTPSVGNAVIVTIGCFGSSAGSSITSVTDNQTGNTYSQRVVGSNALHTNSFVYSCDSLVGASGTFTVTVNFASSNFGTAAAIEVSGLLASPFDQTGTNSSTSSQGGGTITASGANTNATAFIVAAVCENVNSTTAGIVTPSGYTAIVTEQDGTNNGAMQGVYKLVSSTETSSVVWTWSGGNSDWAGCIATYKGSTTTATPYFVGFRSANVLLRR